MANKLKDTPPLTKTEALDYAAKLRQFAADRMIIDDQISADINMFMAENYERGAADGTFLNEVVDV